MPLLQCEPGLQRMTGTTSWERFIQRRTRMTKRLLMVALLLLAASSMLSAQTPSFNTPGGHWIPIAGAFGMAIASGLCGLAQGKAISSAVEGMARNPGAAKAIQLAMLIGLAFIESLALYTLLIVFVFEK